MSRNHKLKAIYLALLAPLPLLGSEPLSFELTARVENNEQLVLEAIDKNSQSGDTARFLKAKAGLELEPVTGLSFSLIGSYSNKQHQQYSEFDQTITMENTDINYQLSTLTFGTQITNADVTVDKVDFMTLQQKSIYLGNRFSDQVYFRIDKTQGDYDLEDFNDRSASSNGWKSNLFIFNETATRYLTLGVEQQTETANAAIHSHKLDGWSASYHHEFEMLGRIHEWRLSLSSESQDYQTSAELFKQPRQDRKSIRAIGWTAHLNDHFDIEFEYRWKENRSNQEEFSYQSNQTAVNLNARF
jgi:hypothetical protein